MVGWMGIRSPTSQPSRSTSARPTIAPFRVSIQRSFASSDTRISGYMSRYSAGSTGDCMKKLDGSWYTPPNQVMCMASTTPGISSMSAS